MYQRPGNGEEIIAYVDVLLRDAARWPQSPEHASFRSTTPEDGLSIFVAHKSAGLVGAELDAAGRGAAATYRLRLPSFRTAGGAVPD